jgi:hypothetical protein
VNTRIELKGDSHTEEKFREGMLITRMNWNQELRAFVRYLQPVDNIELFVLNTIREMLKKRCVKQFPLNNFMHSIMVDNWWI